MAESGFGRGIFAFWKVHLGVIAVAVVSFPNAGKGGPVSGKFTGLSVLIFLLFTVLACGSEPSPVNGTPAPTTTLAPTSVSTSTARTIPTSEEQESCGPRSGAIGVISAGWSHL